MKEVMGFNITDKEFKLLSKKAEADFLNAFFIQAEGNKDSLV